jgi:hypothetical protein
MKKLIGLILFLISTNIYAWNVFGPKDYDECILKNMKGVTSDIGARFVDKSCREKFKDNQEDKVQYSTTNAKLSEACDIYWNGRSFLRGNVSSNPEFKIMKIARYGLEVIHLGIPKLMYNELNLENMRICLIAVLVGGDL